MNTGFKILVLLVFILLSSCNKVKNNLSFQNRLINGQEYYLDSFYIIEHNNDSLIDQRYINISNDTLYMLEDSFSDCTILWKLGYFGKENNKITSLSNECGKSTIINHLVSEYQNVNLDGHNKFNLSIGTNGDIEKMDGKMMLYFSKSDNIISIKKLDTISLPPFW